MQIVTGFTEDIINIAPYLLSYPPDQNVTSVHRISHKQVAMRFPAHVHATKRINSFYLNESAVFCLASPPGRYIYLNDSETPLIRAEWRERAVHSTQHYRILGVVTDISASRGHFGGFRPPVLFLETRQETSCRRQVQFQAGGNEMREL